MSDKEKLMAEYEATKASYEKLCAYVERLNKGDQNPPASPYL